MKTFLSFAGFAVCIGIFTSSVLVALAIYFGLTTLYRFAKIEKPTDTVIIYKK